MSPHCADETKYGVVDSVVKQFRGDAEQGREGLRDNDPRSRHRQRRARHVEDGSWGLVRASSNKPELVVVVESPVSEQRMREPVQSGWIQCAHPSEAGEYNRRSELHVDATPYGRHAREKRGIQYAAALRFHQTRSGILDHPLSRVTTIVLVCKIVRFRGRMTALPVSMLHLAPRR